METYTVEIPEDFEDLIPGFLQNRSKEVIELRQLIQAKDFEAIKACGHSLKGITGSYGFMKAHEIGQLIEEAARKENINTLTDLVNEYEHYFQNIKIVYVEEENY